MIPLLNLLYIDIGWNVFKPILDAFENQRRNIVYLTSAEDDPAL